MQGVLRGGWTFMLRMSEEYKEKMTAYRKMDLAEIILLEEDDFTSIVDLYDQAVYIRDYKKYLETVQEQAKRMSNSSLFAKDKTSYVYRNIQKTAKDFESLQEIKVEFGSDRALEAWLSFKTADVFHLLVILIFVLSFLEDRRNGFYALVRSTKNGRTVITGVRAGILLGVSAVYTVLLYAVPLAIGFLIYGGMNDLGRSVQSIVFFKTCSFHVTVLGWICLFLIVKTVSAFFMGVFFWFILSFLSQVQIAWVVILGILGVEYLAKTLIAPQMAIGFLRFVNIYSFISPTELLSVYQNINLFGLPVSSLKFMAWLWAVLFAAMIAGLICVQIRRYPFGNKNILEGAMRVLRRFFDFFRSRFSIGLTEAYKLLVLGGTILYLALGVFLGLRMRLEGWHYVPGSDGNANEMIKAEYRKNILGPFDEEKVDFLARARARLEDDPSVSVNYREGLELLEKEIEDARIRAKERAYEFWIVDDVPINNHFGPKVWDLTRQNAFVVLVLIILCSSQVFVIERREGMEKLLRTAKKGRVSVFWRKYAVLAFMALTLWAAFYGREWQQLIRECGKETLAASINNYSLFAGFPLSIRLGTFLILLNAIRIIALFMAACITMWFSMHSDSWEKAALFSAATLLIPAALYFFGQNWAGYVSLLPFVNGGEVLIGDSGSLSLMRMMLGWLAVTILLTSRIYRDWTKTR